MPNKKVEKVEETARKQLNERGVTVNDIAELVYFLQVPYHPDLKMDVCRENVERVIAKREVQNAILTGIALDVLAEEKNLNSRFKKFWLEMKVCMGLMK